MPKPELLEASVTRAGVEGDFNLYRQTKKAGDPEMAVLLIARETLEDLHAAGWPVRPGDLGENITTTGIPYAMFEPPRRVRVGEVTLRTTKRCVPCTNLYALPYVGEARGPAFLKATLGRRGWFASVEKGGRIRRGDAVYVEG